MERKYFLKLQFSYTTETETNRVVDCKKIHFKNAKDANDFKSIVKFIFEDQEKSFNNPMALGYQKLAERLLDPNNQFDDIRFMDKFEIYVETNERIN